MSFITICIYLGGAAVSSPTRKIKLSDRIFWPVLMGYRLGKWSYDGLDEE